MVTFYNQNEPIGISSTVYNNRMTFRQQFYAHIKKNRCTWNINDLHVSLMFWRLCTPMKHSHRCFHLDLLGLCGCVQTALDLHLHDSATLPSSSVHPYVLTGLRHVFQTNQWVSQLSAVHLSVPPSAWGISCTLWALHAHSAMLDFGPVHPKPQTLNPRRLQLRSRALWLFSQRTTWLRRSQRDYMRHLVGNWKE